MTGCMGIGRTALRIGAVLLTVCGLAGCVGSAGDSDGSGGAPAGQEPIPSAVGTPLASPIGEATPVVEPLEAAPPAGDRPAPGGPVTCPEADTTVNDAAELESALAGAQPGHTIHLANGTYSGEFLAARPGTEQDPIFLCGSSEAVLEGHGVKEGYVLHLKGASHWRLVGFTVRNGKKGVVVEESQHAVIQGLTVTQIGDEAIHLRRFSSDGVVINNTISHTGLRREKFGEGVYVGTAESNWCEISDCRPDTSDRTLVQGNTISATTAESVDIKEGTTGGRVIGNRFDGSMLSGADSWVDVKGNGWLIEGNAGHSSPTDGFQTHEILEGWGTRNRFQGNVAVVGGTGFGFHLAPVAENEVSCNNKASGAAQGLTNTACS